MSGGSLDYIYSRIEYDVAPKVPDRELREMTYDLAKLFHDLEWYLSSDYSEEDWNKTRDAFKKKWFGSRSKRLKELIEKGIQECREELLGMIGENTKDEQ